jgi:hypothetical protein
MDQTTLVIDNKIEEGKKLLKKLDDYSLIIKSAFWYLSPENNEWRLNFATPIIDKDGPRKAYTKFQSILSKNKDINIKFNEISIISPMSNINKLLSSAIKTGEGISGIRFTGNVINGFLIEDAYIYRVN